MATLSSTTDVPTIHIRKMCEFDAVGLAALGDEAQHVRVVLDADLDEVGVADRVDPDRPA